MAEDDIFYDQVAEEMLRGFRDPGLMAKAAGKSLGDNDLAQSLYIELRVLRLKEKVAEEAEKAEWRAAERAWEAKKKAAKEARRAREVKALGFWGGVMQPLLTALMITAFGFVVLLMLASSCNS